MITLVKLSDSIHDGGRVAGRACPWRARAPSLAVLAELSRDCRNQMRKRSAQTGFACLCAASLLGLVPSSFLYVYSGAVSKSMAVGGGGSDEGGWAAALQQLAPLVLTAAITFKIVQIAQQVSPGRCSHSDTTLYVSLVILHTKYTGRRQNDFNVHAYLRCR